MPTTEQIIRSRRQSAPLEWVKFELGTLATFRYASGRSDHVYSGDTYEAVAMTRTAPNISQEINQSGITITLPRDAALWQLYKYVAPTISCNVTIYGQQVGDATVYQVFQGFVAGFAEKDEKVEIKVDSDVSSLRRLGLRYLYSPKCAFFVYYGRCPVPKTAFETETVITGENAANLQVQSSDFAAKPDGWFTLGWIETEHAERVMIVAHTGDTLILLKPTRESLLGKTIKAYAGCNLDSDCAGKFGAYTNGGRDSLRFPLVPIKPPNAGLT